MSYYIAWQKVPGKNNTRRYAILMERLPVPGGINARTHCYLGKDPLAAIEKLYQEDRLTTEQVLSISERKLPELAELKEKLRKCANERKRAQTSAKIKT
jgi:hypothetical protein